MSKSLGLDIGIGSIGSALIEDDNNLLYMGVRSFNQAKEASESRNSRAQRRNIARKRWRKEQLKEAFTDFNILTKEEMDGDGYFVFTTNNDKIKRPKDKTVYHLRNRALNEKVEKREIILCLYNILHARGHFLSETIDFSKRKVEFEDFKERFYDYTENYLALSEDAKKEINEELLRCLFETSLSSNDVNKKISNLKIAIEEETEKRLKAIIRLLAGYTVNTNDIDENFVFNKKCKINDIKASSEEVDQLLSNIVELYDLSRINKVLQGDCNYLCQVAVKKLDTFENIVKEYGVNSKEYSDYISEVGENCSSKAKHKRIVKNLTNNYPNGLYVKECIDILKQQSKYYPEITPEFIDVCSSIISARIPYYIGPLNENAKNGWVTKTGKFKYSYSYSNKELNAVDESSSIIKWKERMISHCTYLPEEYALPVGSFLAETFNILNEMNILSAQDANGGDYYLTKDEKIMIFDNYFLKQKNVKFSEVRDLLGIGSYGTKSNNASKFNNSYSLYFAISDVLSHLKLDSIMDIWEKPEKIDEIESIILDINLFDEEDSKLKHFSKKYTIEEAKKLSKLKSKSFYSYSRKFIFETGMDINGSSLIDKLFEDNCSLYKNEQMTLISQATDRNGNSIDYISNKYVRRIKQNNNELNYNILVDNDKPVIPVSRPVLRALNECIKVYSGIVAAYGAPDRVIIETARDLTDSKEKKQRTLNTGDAARKQYDSLLEQLKEHKAYSAYFSIDEYDEIEKYLIKNKVKMQLYISQGGIDLLTGKPINLSNLDNYEVDHILPRGFGDDSLDDKMLISRIANAKKSNRLPLEFINSNENIGNNEFLNESKFIEIINMLHEIKAISNKKYDRLMLSNQNDLDEFINQNLVDTRYIIKEFTAIIKAYNTVKGYNTHVVSLKSAYTSLYRKAFNMDKVRNYGDQHHAHDAALLVIADKTLSTYYPYYDLRKNSSKSDSENRFASYNEFIKTALVSDKNEKEELYTFIRSAYRKAYNSYPLDTNSIIDKVKNYIPFYSLKTEKNHKGKFFDATIKGQESFSESDVLTIVGVNDDKKVFSSVECAAVDFYKFTNKKGKKEHLAVHIPKVIIDKDGNIDQEKYKTLILKHYKKPELIDEDGNLKEYYFRFRAFRNDLIYENISNNLLKFNIGSIVNKKLEVKFVNVFSYNDVYENGRKIANKLTSKLNIKTRSNPDGIEFRTIDKEIIVSIINTLYWGLDVKDKKLNTVLDNIKNDRNLYDLSNHLAYYSLIINRLGTPPTIEGQYTPVINSDIIKGYDDAMYIKLKYNILGIRMITNSNNKAIIETPLAVQGQFRKISKEKFSWKIGNSIV